MAGVADASKARNIYLMLRERIGRGALAPGARVPSEVSVAAEHGVSRMTARRALSQLAAEGVVSRRAGSGTFVKAGDTGPVLRAELTDVFAHLKEMGRRSGVRLLSFAYVAPHADVADALGLAAGELVQRSVRVRLMDGAPFSFLTTQVPEHIGSTYTEADLAATPLLQLLERSGITAERASQTIGATLAGPESAQALEVGLGSPLLSLTRVVHGADGRGVEHLHALYRPDRFSFRMDLQRTGVPGRRSWKTLPVRPAPSQPADRAPEPARPSSDPPLRPGRRRRRGGAGGCPGHPPGAGGGGEVGHPAARHGRPGAGRRVGPAGRADRT